MNMFQNEVNAENSNLLWSNVESLLLWSTFIFDFVQIKFLKGMSLFVDKLMRI